MVANIYSRCSIECVSLLLTKKSGNNTFVSFPVSVDFESQGHVVPVERSVPNPNLRARFTVLSTKSLHPNMTLDESKEGLILS